MKKVEKIELGLYTGTMVGYVISQNRDFGNFKYNGTSLYYLAKKIEWRDNRTGNIERISYAPIKDKNKSFLDKKITSHKGMKVEEI